MISPTPLDIRWCDALYAPDLQQVIEKTLQKRPELSAIINTNSRIRGRNKRSSYLLRDFQGPIGLIRSQSGPRISAPETSLLEGSHYTDHHYQSRVADPAEEGGCLMIFLQAHLAIVLPGNHAETRDCPEACAPGALLLPRPSSAHARLLLEDRLRVFLGEAGGLAEFVSPRGLSLIDTEGLLSRSLCSAA